MKARPRHATGDMNKLETRFSEYLEGLKIAGDILDWGFERYKLRLAKATFFTPDFDVTTSDETMIFYEVKGHWEDDARVKMKVVAKEFWQFNFIGVMWDKERKEWKFEPFDY